ncbi:hypothetical protein ABT269_00780 [Streptomyces viridosporus]|uniref:hypothetical protein n=1 Tax=Streptomyces viridosporus TaxID=67581 RepID=UPI00332B9C08
MSDIDTRTRADERSVVSGESEITLFAPLPVHRPGFRRGFALLHGRPLAPQNDTTVYGGMKLNH